jgi:hypothetical protein
LLEESDRPWSKGTAAELRRLHEVNAELVEALESMLDYSDLIEEHSSVDTIKARAAVRKAKGETT